LYKITLSLPADMSATDIHLVGEVFSDLANSYSAIMNAKTRLWDGEWLVDEAVSEADMAARLSGFGAAHGFEFGTAACATFEEQDWLVQAYRGFEPFSVGPFYIYGAGHEGGVPEGLMGLRIDEESAFGSGSHGTTKGCLRAMLDLKAVGQCPWNVLDMGTGSGILSVAAWKLWKTPILAVDVDEASVQAAEAHRVGNGVPGGATEMRCVQGDGFKTGAVQAKGPFDLVIANILAGRLVEMAAELVAVMDDNGYVILSGILHEQAEWVIGAYEAQGLQLKKRNTIDEWVTLVMKAP
jgi:ribosomal protein L11 methyltransferase